VQDVVLLHLPADKKFLAEQAQHKFGRQAFLLRFRRYARKKTMLRGAGGLASSFFGGQGNSEIHASVVFRMIFPHEFFAPGSSRFCLWQPLHRRGLASTAEIDNLPWGSWKSRGWLWRVI
jgi:hypothetical protein